MKTKVETLNAIKNARLGTMLALPGLRTYIHDKINPLNFLKVLPSSPIKIWDKSVEHLQHLHQFWCHFSVTYVSCFYCKNRRIILCLMCIVIICWQKHNILELQQNFKMLESNYFQKVIFKIPMFLQPEGVNLWQFKIRLFDLEISEVYGIKDKGIRKSEFVAKTQLFCLPQWQRVSGIRLMVLS